MQVTVAHEDIPNLRQERKPPLEHLTNFALILGLRECEIEIGNCMCPVDVFEKTHFPHFQSLQCVTWISDSTRSLKRNECLFGYSECCYCSATVSVS